MITNKKNILIVEDEILIAQLLKKTIVNHGYDCAGIAINFNAAELLLNSTKVDLVLLDVKISGVKSGLDIAAFINENYGIPFLFITSFNDSKTLANIKELAPKGYINKPINNATLLTTIDIIFNNNKEKEPVYINVNIGATSYNIYLSELLYVTSEHVYVRLHYKEKTVLIRSSLMHFIELMPKNSLLQINRSSAINPKYIESLTSTNVVVFGVSLKISKKHIDNFSSFLN